MSKKVEHVPYCICVRTQNDTNEVYTERGKTMNIRNANTKVWRGFVHVVRKCRKRWVLKFSKHHLQTYLSMSWLIIV